MVIPKRFFIHAIAAFGLPLVGCGLFSPDPAPPEEAPPPRQLLDPISPENVLNNLAFAYENRDYDAYVDALDEGFRFVPSINDTIDEFDRDEDLRSTENMFNNVDDVSLRLIHQAAVPSDRQEFPAEDGYRMILVSNVNLRVDTRDFSQGSRLILVVTGDPATFIFKPDTTTTPVEYRIALQQDDS